jgi:hypothetical protein
MQVWLKWLEKQSYQMGKPESLNSKPLEPHPFHFDQPTQKSISFPLWPCRR